ncbi:hydroxyisourate hydrolase [Salmonella enterica subsp. enterica serovar Newport]|uniref:5-hydroxyisourate hydrolase n=2 Tax=Salmonella enterica TaxID=28901 RepID=A0A743TWL2_SALER|nr:hydroxyisourate hydrolase [Salmonella enterica]EAW1164903.1 hydroxyisourate hydrolase [Salmonella enterica subsp. enterica]EBK1959853.1 hydroxyisourate hydrolase [Salmonella enterica subsp. enterica serovar Newport]EBV1275770.1 hydroxyisourate hydrolase [Salmonella enterica subsp. enterica serovar Oranienburg]EBV8365239.1 hydroxyisourate hydrolase [Salmonella enterica subsp. enterica serovar Java]EBV8394377.1 hydroxyisourate hydrolase [Salmonella enterica subsp. enterica serovar Virchow]EB
MSKMIKYSLAAALMSVSAFSMAATSEKSATPMKNPVSVHVLNLQTGIPSEGVTVVLDKKEGDKWVKLNSAVTSQDGRINALYPDGKEIQPGDYRVTFETGKYYADHNEDTFFPEIPVIIHVPKAGEHYHVPLLLSQYGYSTYRGS